MTLLKLEKVGGALMLVQAALFTMALGLATTAPARVAHAAEATGAQLADPLSTSSVQEADPLLGFVTNPFVASALVFLGVLGLMIELKAPGTGLGGIVAVLALGLFFSGHILGDLASWTELGLLLTGLTLVAIEIFLIPGLGVPGAIGGILVIVSLVLAMVGAPIPEAWSSGELAQASTFVFFATAAAVTAGIVVARSIPEHLLPEWLVLRTAIEDQSGASTYPELENAMEAFLGQVGVALTDLRPSGSVRVGDRNLDVVSRSAWVKKGTRVRIVEISGVRVMVEAVSELASGAASDTAVS